MATTTKAKKESAVNAVKTTSPVPTPEKKGVSKAAKTVVSGQEVSPKPAEKGAKKVAPVVEPAVELVEPKAISAASKDPKWQEIRMILVKLKEDTLREIRKSVKKGTEAVAAIEPGGDIYDQASSERDRELGLLLGDREREKIHSIDEALLRIDEGEYGICEECDEDIPIGRLKAMPFTRHCVKCKSDLEKLQAQTKRVEEERAYREIPLGSEEEES